MADEEIPVSGKKLLSILEKKGPLTQKQLIKASAIPARTARYALRRLIELGLIVKRSNLSDMRSVFYFIVNNDN
ncbi:MAG: winged helix-turn-helix transcriptional regulator [Candidatus Heimdallarchaeota archaeon]|jgi:DNA-binding MarR family transcriptional regulator|nr:winged helix-turn-helix transcriptional regulator [Candidatus Heimdallarchaeota archaeon]MCG3227342.1 winged helix-turn-helix transcriptional regulator [Candidatus Heimdallarchaeota archaeon]MCK4770759.1 winged helix-turn-helix transcriptional regulator [Candidatus Heimdallarchaeota archaeon]MCK4876591.1 winged helix-turn-helix transcriptional regulator [Candidatus Heimdallarchaeota archaeon]NPD90096.1 winged helix-turn-helix transcriptional regulator [Asgard group archaeon]